MNLKNRLNIKFVKADKLKSHVQSNKLVSIEPINSDAKIWEVRKRKNIIKDTTPIHCSAMILNSAKLHFLQFVSDIAEELDPKAYRIIYMGEIYFFYKIYYFL